MPIMSAADLDSQSGDNENTDGQNSKTGTATPFQVTLGLRLEAKDYNGLWYPAKVTDIDEEKQVITHESDY